MGISNFWQVSCDRCHSTLSDSDGRDSWYRHFSNAEEAHTAALEAGWGENSSGIFCKKCVKPERAWIAAGTIRIQLLHSDGASVLETVTNSLKRDIPMADEATIQAMASAVSAIIEETNTVTEEDIKSLYNQYGLSNSTQ